jgi:hypothetical protein
VAIKPKTDTVDENEENKNSDHKDMVDMSASYLHRKMSTIGPRQQTNKKAFISNHFIPPNSTLQVIRPKPPMPAQPVQMTLQKPV